MEQLAENLWRLTYPLKVLGFDVQRNVTIIRLANGKLVIHSTAPFSEDDVNRIHRLGAPQWILDGMLDHDSFADDGRAAFPELTYLGPEGFAERVGFPVTTLVPPPEPWGDELQVLKLQGIPSFEEHLFFHSPSRTLIVCDLFLHVSTADSRLKKLLARAATGCSDGFGISRRLRLAIRDRSALRESLDELLQWNFERIVVGHGEPIAREAKPRATRAIEEAGLR